MSDRVAVMSAGLLQQVATPRELYDNPATPFVARFVGETNAIPGRITDVQAGTARIETDLGPLTGRAGQGAAPGVQGRCPRGRGPMGDDAPALWGRGTPPCSRA